MSTSTILGEETSDITLFKHIEKGRNDLLSPHKHDFYFIFFVEKGGGYHDIDFERLEVVDYQVFFLRPQQVHYWLLENHTVGFQLMFSPTILQSLNTTYSPLAYFQLGAPNQMRLSKEAFEQYKTDLEELEHRLGKDQIIDREISLLSFHLLLKHLHKHFLSYHGAVNPQGIDKNIVQFEELLEIHFKEQSGVAFYAEKLKITPNYLNILCKKVLGTNAGSLVQNRLLLEAKRLLTTTNISVKEIAFSLSFNDTSYFNNFFKKQLGVTPGEFRSSYKKSNNL
nr:helix-turn-helix domain-containing protein [Myroides oncorhynchi]